MTHRTVMNPWDTRTPQPPFTSRRLMPRLLSLYFPKGILACQMFWVLAGSCWLLAISRQFLVFSRRWKNVIPVGNGLRPVPFCPAPLRPFTDAAEGGPYSIFLRRRIVSWVL